MNSVPRTRWTKLFVRFQSQRTMYGKITHVTSGQGAPHFTDKQKWLKKNFGCLNTHIVYHHSPKSAFKLACEATVSRSPDAGRSEESDQHPVGEPGSMELISIRNRHRLTEEPLKLFSVPLTSSKNLPTPKFVQPPP